jgi:hypothetical protein
MRWAGEKRTLRTQTCLRTLAALPALLLLLACGCADRIKWYPDFNQAQPVAQRDNRPMLLYFWDWLSPDTARLDMQVFPNPRVVAATRHTVNVRLEQTWFRDLARRYDVRATPTFILTDPQGVEHTRRTGVPSDQEFIAWLSDALTRASSTQQAPAKQAAATQAAQMTPAPPVAPYVPTTIPTSQ